MIPWSSGVGYRVKACPHWQQIVAENGNKLLPEFVAKNGNKLLRKTATNCCQWPVWTGL